MAGPNWFPDVAALMKERDTLVAANEKAALKAGKAAYAAVIDRRWMFGPGYDRNGEAMAEAVAKEVRRVIRGVRASARKESRKTAFNDLAPDQEASNA